MGFSIHIDLDTLQQSNSGAMTGNISVGVDGVCFPEKDWNDFVVILLSWWSEAALNLREKKPFTLNFMDGPHHILIKPEGHFLDMQYFTDSDSKDCVYHAESASTELLNEICKACNLVLRECHIKKHTTADLDALENSFKLLQKISIE